MSSTYGDSLKLSIFGQSHGSAIGMTLDGIPAGLPVDFDGLQQFLSRRAPGTADWSTPRREEDQPEFLSGIVEGFTCGAPIAAMIRNHNTRSIDYSNLKDCPRPGHADYTAQIKYGGFQDAAGGGHFSGRLTAALCIAGGMCKQWLNAEGVNITARITTIGGIADPSSFDPDILSGKDFPVIDVQAEAAMKQAIMVAKADGDSLGGEIECIVTGLPAGIGEPIFGGVESKLAQILYGIPAVKSLEFGLGSAVKNLRGSEVNDCFIMDNGNVKTRTNHCGGILGGITNGMDIVFRVCMKPTPSISRPQQSVSMSIGENTVLTIQGRHDPCIVPRAIPVVEAAAAIALYDLFLGNTQTTRRK